MSASAFPRCPLSCPTDRGFSRRDHASHNLKLPAGGNGVARSAARPSWAATKTIAHPPSPPPTQPTPPSTVAPTRLQGEQTSIDLPQQLRLLIGRSDWKSNEPLRQSHIGNNAGILTVEMKEIMAIEVERRRPELSKGWIRTERFKQRSNQR
jgi:hypothetical protein